MHITTKKYIKQLLKFNNLNNPEDGMTRIVTKLSDFYYSRTTKYCSVLNDDSIFEITCDRNDIIRRGFHFNVKKIIQLIDGPVVDEVKQELIKERRRYLTLLSEEKSKKETLISNANTLFNEHKIEIIEEIKKKYSNMKFRTADANSIAYHINNKLFNCTADIITLRNLICTLRSY